MNLNAPRYVTDHERKLLIDLEHSLRMGGFSTTDGLEKHLKLKMKDVLSDTNVVEQLAFENEQMYNGNGIDDKYLILGLFNRVNELEQDLLSLHTTVISISTIVNKIIDDAQNLTYLPRP